MGDLEVSKDMEQEAQQYIDVAREGLDVAHKSGLLKTLFSWLPSRRPEHPAQTVDYREEALRALQENAVETFAGLALTVEEAARILEPGFALDDLDKVNSTWQRHWTEGTSKVGVNDGERRTWWANLLAGEIQQPETYSLRTLAVMDTLSTKEAKLFTRVCDYVWDSSGPVLILPPDKSTLWTPDFSEGALLESAGLAMFNSVGQFTWGMMAKEESDTTAHQPLSYIPMTFQNDKYLIEVSGGKEVMLRCGKLQLTDVGREMYRLTTPNYQQSYRDEIVEEWRQSHNVTQHVVLR